MTSCGKERIDVKQANIINTRNDTNTQNKNANKHNPSSKISNNARTQKKHKCRKQQPQTTLTSNKTIQTYSCNNEQKTQKQTRIHHNIFKPNEQQNTYANEQAKSN